MDEFEFINSIKQTSYKQPSLIKGIGDDAAVFNPGSYDVVTAVDTFVDQIHFSKKTMNPFHIGYKVLAANMSDMAAMGAEPKFYLVSIVIPDSVSDNTLVGIYAGMREIARDFDVDLIGGDTVSGGELMISVTMIGYVKKDGARYRHTAAAGDLVFVTGTVGDAAAGLHLLQTGETCEDSRYFIKRHQMPYPRIDFSKLVRNVERVSLNDVSDGIASELHEIAVASGVTITIDDSLIPTHASFAQFTAEQQHAWKYFGGEDFELLGTIPEADYPQLVESCIAANIQVTKIGRVAYNEDSHGHVYVVQAGERVRLKGKGYTHRSV